MKKALDYIVGKRMPDVNSWQTSIAIILNAESKTENTVTSIASKAFLTETEVVESLKALINSGFKMGKNKKGNLIFSVGDTKYVIKIPRKKEEPKETGSMEMFVDDGANSPVVDEAITSLSSEDQITEDIIEALLTKNLSKLDELLVVADVDWAHTNNNNEGVLSAGCSKQDVNILSKLIDKGLNVQEGLMWVCQNGNKYRGLVAFFVKHGADTNAGEGLMPLQWAIFTGAIGVAQELIEHGANVNYVSDSGEPLLQTAVDSDNSQVVELMIMNGADVNMKNSDGDGPLHWAAATGAVDIIRMLLYNEADANRVNNVGKTARDIAISSGKDRVAGVLKKY
jgi:hypothetical protein